MSVVRRLEREGECDLPARERFEIESHLLPAIGRGEGACELHFPRGDPEGDRPLLHRPDGQIQERSRWHANPEAELLGGAANNRLAVDLTQSLPADPRRDRGEVLLSEDEPHGFDLEIGAFGVRRAQQDVTRVRGADRGDGGCGNADAVGLELSSRNQRCREGPGKELGAARDLSDVDRLRPPEGDGEVRPFGRSRAHHDLMKDVALVESGRSLRVEDGDLGVGTSREPAVSRSESLDAGPRFPLSRCLRVLEPPLRWCYRCRRSRQILDLDRAELVHESDHRRIGGRSSAGAEEKENPRASTHSAVPPGGYAKRCVPVWQPLDSLLVSKGSDGVDAARAQRRSRTSGGRDREQHRGHEGEAEGIQRGDAEEQAREEMAS